MYRHTYVVAAAKAVREKVGGFAFRCVEAFLRYSFRWRCDAMLGERTTQLVLRGRFAGGRVRACECDCSCECAVIFARSGFDREPDRQTDRQEL